MIKIAFYKIKDNEKAGFLDKAIAFFTSSFKEKINGEFLNSYSHCEIIIDDLMISSSFRDGGVRIKKFNNSKKWDLVEIKNVSEEKIKAFLYEELGKKYDYLGVLGILFFNKDNENKWFCSELCLKALQIGGIYKLGKFNASNTSPNRLFKQLKELK